MNGKEAALLAFSMMCVCFLAQLGLESAKDARRQTAIRMDILANNAEYECDGFYNPCEFLVKVKNED